MAGSSRLAVRSSPDLSPSGLTILERTAGATGTWRRLAITNNFDSQASLALAAGGAVNVAWARAGAGIRFTSNKTGTWKVEVISTGGDGYSPSLALTNGGTPSVAYRLDRQPNGPGDPDRIEDGFGLEDAHDRDGPGRGSLAPDRPVQQAPSRLRRAQRFGAGPLLRHRPLGDVADDPADVGAPTSIRRGSCSTSPGTSTSRTNARRRVRRACCT